MASAVASEVANAVAHAPFKVGMKEVYLPDFTVALKRTPSLPPTQASFVVPLWFSKLDLRDYLWHAYNLPVGPSIRSYVKQSRIRQGADKNVTRPQYKRWHRPRSTKHMTVEMEQPFVWPEGPVTEEDFKPYNRLENKMAKEENEAHSSRIGPTSDQVGVAEERRVAMREQAKALLEGRERWKPGVGRGAGVMYSR